MVLSAFSRMKNHSDPASHALLNYPLRPLIFSGSPPRILRIVLAQPRRLPQPARTSAFQTSFGDGCDISTRRKVCTNGCTVTGDSVSEDLLFVCFQMTFAILTATLMIGAFAGRMKFSAMLIFMILWSLCVYSPVCHWVWAEGGFFFDMGALDYAGGTVVHINAGVSGLVACLVLGKRLGYGREPMSPHNLTFAMLGAAILWIGWFGFNGGSGLAANERAVMAILVTQIAAAAAGVSWMLVEWMLRGRPSLLGLISGAVGGLVVITPASGFVGPVAALVMGLIGGVCCFWGAVFLKRMAGWDDSLDAFGVHGVGGIVGALLTGVFASSAVTGSEMNPVMTQVGIQAASVVATMVYASAVSWILLKIIDVVMGLRVTSDEERMGLDLSLHGERIE